VAVFRCQAGAGEIWATIEEFCAQNAIAFERSSEESGLLSIGRRETGFCRHSYPATIELKTKIPCGAVAAELEIRFFSLARSVAVWVFVVIGATVLLPLALREGYQKRETTALLLAGGGLTCLVWVLRVIKSGTPDEVTALIAYLSRHFQVIQRSPIGFEYRPRAVQTFVLLFVILTLGCWLVVSPIRILGVVGVAFLLGALPMVVMNVVVGSWREDILGLESDHALSAFLALLVLAALSLFAVGEFASSKAMNWRIDPLRSGPFFNEFVTIWGQTNVPIEFARQIVHRSAGGEPGLREYPFEFRLHRIFALACCSLLVVIYAWITWWGGKRQQQRMLDRRMARWSAVPVPVRHWKDTPITRLALVAAGLSYSLLDWISILVCVEASSYLIVGRPVILPVIAGILSILQVHIELLLTSSVVGDNTGAARVLLLLAVVPIMLPGMVNVMVMVYKLFCFIRTEMSVAFRRLSMPMIDDATIDVVKTACGDLQIERPSIYLTSDSPEDIYSETSILGFGSRIVMSERCFTLLRGNELSAVLLHELYHIKHSLWRLESLKVLSALTLPRSYYFALLYDFSRHELEADRFAVKVLGNKDLLVSALTKLAVASALRQQSTEQLLDRRGIARVLQLLFNSSVLSAAYPLLAERIAALRE